MAMLRKYVAIQMLANGMDSATARALLGTTKPGEQLRKRNAIVAWIRTLSEYVTFNDLGDCVARWVRRKERTEIANNTEFTEEQILTFMLIGCTVNKWRQREIKLFQHPTEPDSVVSVGITFDHSLTVITTESKKDWEVALSYIRHGKVYVSE